MNTARLIWTPYPWQAGFCITDDTDDADLPRVRLVYDLLRQLRLLTTKTVWAFSPEEPSGIPPTPSSTLRGITLEDRAYLKYCRMLRAEGFEIALHGASAGNNRRGRIIRAFDLLEQYFGNDGTYICHAKNAENLYWEEKCANDLMQRSLLKRFTCHRTSGEEEGSPWFWGDIALEKVARIRLFRTRETNTLAVNPSMPYYDPAKPFVRSWFSATKRSFHDCTTQEVLDKLVRENGLTVLYQYMHRYANKRGEKLDPQFQKDAERLAGESRILVDTTARIMERLRLMQGIFIGHQGDNIWIFNTNRSEVREVQIHLPSDYYLLFDEMKTTLVKVEKEILRIPSLPPQGLQMLCFNKPVWIHSARSFRFNNKGRGTCQFGHATFHASFETDDPVPAWSLALSHNLEGPYPLSGLSHRESQRLFYGQMAIILRELFLRQRYLNAEKFLTMSPHPLEDHGNW